MAPQQVRHRQGKALFRGIRSERLAPATVRKVWDRARRAALDNREYDSPIARRPYDLRHACLSTWLNAGVSPQRVAERAGHSVDVLLRIYAKCVAGEDEVANRRIADALRDE